MSASPVATPAPLDRTAPIIPVATLTRLLTGTGETVVVRAPGTGTELGVVPTQREDEVAHVVASARAAQHDWVRWPVRERARVIRRFSELVHQQREAILDVIQAETGKSRVHALEEVIDVVLGAAHDARTAPGTLRERGRGGAFPVLTRTTEVRHPKGVVGVIAPWNYPFTLAATDAVPALLAGNAVVIKPDAQTPFSALTVLRLLREAGLPDGVMQVVTGPGETIGPALIDVVDFVMFTGSTATGTTVAQRCASRLIGCSAELGGKNPLLVLEDADVDRAAEGAVRASFSNAGQLCISIERIYVAEPLADRFTAAMVAATARLRLGVGYSWDLDVGSLVSAAQLARVQRHVDDAVARGARVLAGGRARPDLGPYVFEPTVLTDVPEDALLAREETFGPVVSITVTRDDDESVARANDSDYGLNASVWGSSHRGGRVARRLAVGTVNVNEGYAAAWASHAAPMGGWKSSGLGRRHGREGLLKYTEAQTVATQRLLPIAPWPGMSNAQYARFIGAAAGVLRRVR